MIDVTHPRFAVAEDFESLEALHEALLQRERRHRLLPGFLMRIMLKMAARKSRLVRAMFGDGNSTFLDGLSTYAMKIGAANLLAPYNTSTDRQFAASPHATYMRLRTQQVARMLADAMARELALSAPTPLALVNIAGGPAIDSINALIIAARNAPGLLARPITIQVLDADEAGPAFGANALTELKASGGPLDGIDVAYEYIPYDWNDVAPLSGLVGQHVSRGAVVIASSEGGLFEYGSDEAIIANLKALGADGAGARCVVGSVTRADEARAKLIGSNRFSVIPRGIIGFAPLAASAGYRLGEVHSTVWSDQVS